MHSITAQDVAEALTAYLYHKKTLSDLVSWAEQAMTEGDFAHEKLNTIRDIVSQLGLADVKEFGMTWEDCEQFLSRLGYAIRREVVAK